MFKSKKNILIAGRGAVACLLAAKLFSSGYSVSIWHPRCNQKTKRVTNVKCENNNKFTLSVSETDDLEIGVEFSFIIMATKTFQLRDTLSFLSFFVPSKTPVVLTQNGVCAVALASYYFSNVMCSVFTFVCEMDGDHTVVNNLDGEISLAAYSPFSNCRDIERCFFATGYNVTLFDRIEDIIFPKLILASTSALMAVYNLSIQEALEQQSSKKSILHDLLIEGKKVVEKKFFNSKWPTKTAIDAIDKIIVNWEKGGLPWIKHINKLPYSTYTSLYHDLKRKRGVTEVLDLNGELSRIGRTISVPTPINDNLTKIITYAAHKKMTPKEISEFNLFSKGE